MSVSSTPETAIPWFEMRRPSARGEPAWDIALMYPVQGEWSEEDYLSLGTNLLVEFDQGTIEVLPKPNYWHQQIVRLLYHRLLEFVSSRRLGDVIFAPLPVRLSSARYREPDLVYLSNDRVRSLKLVPNGADLAVEVVSEGREARERDFEKKRAEYAAAGIPEYWIVDPELREITVLTLVGSEYQVHGVFRGDATATSVLLAGFEVCSAEVFAAGDPDAASPS